MNPLRFKLPKPKLAGKRQGISDGGGSSKKRAPAAANRPVAAPAPLPPNPSTAHLRQFVDLVEANSAGSNPAGWDSADLRNDEHIVDEQMEVRNDSAGAVAGSQQAMTPAAVVTAPAPGVGPLADNTGE